MFDKSKMGGFAKKAAKAGLKNKDRLKDMVDDPKAALSDLDLDDAKALKKAVDDAQSD